MFSHIFKYSLKVNFRTKETLFWTYLFPILLGTCFFAVFSNITAKTENFSTVKVAVVLEGTNEDQYFKSMADFLAASETPLIAPEYVTESKAINMLENEEVTGIINLEKGVPALTILGDGVNESILKEVLNKYMQISYMLQNIDLTDSNALQAIFSQMLNSSTYIKELKLTDGSMDMFTNYYYSLIAMCCLFGSFAGVECASSVKANLSKIGMRNSVSPVKKLSLILGNFIPAYLIQALAGIILILYLQFVLKVNLAGNIPLIILTSLVGTLVGVGTGTFIGSIPKISENVKITLVLTFSLASSFFSGLMIGDIKYMVEDKLPVFALLNPATAISDALYSLNIYDTYTKFFTHLIVLTIYGVLLVLSSYFMTRRESYANI